MTAATLLFTADRSLSTLSATTYGSQVLTHTLSGGVTPASRKPKAPTPPGMCYTDPDCSGSKKGDKRYSRMKSCCIAWGDDASFKSDRTDRCYNCSDYDYS